MKGKAGRQRSASEFLHCAVLLEQGNDSRVVFLHCKQQRGCAILPRLVDVGVAPQQHLDNIDVGLKITNILFWKIN